MNHNIDIDLIETGELETLTFAELDAVGGGMDSNYKECVLGTTAGGPPGLYPWYATCRTK